MRRVYCADLVAHERLAVVVLSIPLCLLTENTMEKQTVFDLQTPSGYRVKPFYCYACGWQGTHQERILVSKGGKGNSRFYCPQCEGATTIRKTSTTNAKQAEYNRTYREQYPEKVSARLQVSKAVSSGKIPRVDQCKCAMCGQKAEEYHHEDYGKPLDVMPLCVKCHAFRHGRIKVTAITIL